MNTIAGKLPWDPSEHKSVTLGDLAALVAGIAVVLVLPARQSYWPYPADFFGPWPRWLPWCFCLRQAVGAACLALLPVVLWRRACHGGLARPAEFLALCAAMPFLADSIETALIRLSYRTRTGISLTGFGLDGISVAFHNEWRQSSHWVWEQSLLLGGIVALVAFLVGRRRLPGWLSTVFVMIAWLGAYEAAPALASRWIARLIDRVNGQPIGEIAGISRWAVVGLLPRFVLYAVPAIAAVRDVRHDGRARPTWLEWTALGLAAALFLIAEPTELVRTYTITGNTRSWAVETLARAIAMLMALVLAYFVNRIEKRVGSRVASQTNPS
jgi:hypothetical protein